MMAKYNVYTPYATLKSWDRRPETAGVALFIFGQSENLV